MMREYQVLKRGWLRGSVVSLRYLAEEPCEGAVLFMLLRCEAEILLKMIGYGRPLISMQMGASTWSESSWSRYADFSKANHELPTW